jgi:RNA polymerase sigma-70 factor (sigma-E family)
MGRTDQAGTTPWLRGGASRREFERFVGQSTDGLYRTAYLMIWDEAEAEDLVQEAFIKVARHWSRVRAMEHPYAYARRILVNLVLDGAGRRSRRRAELELVPESESGSVLDQRAVVAIERVTDVDALSRALAALAPRQRMVLVLRYWEDLPETEVAALLGCTAGTVKSTASRAAARLATALAATADLDDHHDHHDHHDHTTLLTPVIGGTRP